MDIKELKGSVEAGSTPSFMVWVAADDSALIVAEQYYHKIAQDRKLELKLIDSFDEIDSFSLFSDDHLYILKVDELREYEEHSNLIIVCKKCYTDSATVIPSLESWMVSDWLFQSLQGVNLESVEYLSRKYETRPRELLRASEKLLALDPDERMDILSTMDTTVSVVTSFNLADALIAGDVDAARDMLSEESLFNFSPYSFLLSTLTKFRQILEIKTNPDATPSSAGCKSEKQFKYIYSHYKNIYTNDEVTRIYNFLTGLEKEYKYGGINYDNLIDYIVVNVLGGVPNAS